MFIKRIKRGISNPVITVILLFALSLQIITSLTTLPVSAAPAPVDGPTTNFSWQDSVTILDSATNKTYIDYKPDDRQHTYASLSGKAAICKVETSSTYGGSNMTKPSFGSDPSTVDYFIDIENFNDKSTGVLYKVEAGQVAAGSTAMAVCRTVRQYEIKIADTSTQSNPFEYKSATNITGKDFKDLSLDILAQDDDRLAKLKLVGKYVYIDQSTATDCQSYIVLNTTSGKVDPSRGVLHRFHVDSSSKDCVAGGIVANFNTATSTVSYTTTPATATVTINKSELFVEDTAKNPGSAAAAPAGTGSSTSSTASGPANLTDDCYDKLNGLGMLVCWTVDAADSLYEDARGWVYNLLAIPEATYNGSTGLKDTWNATKNIASTALVLIALVMVASQIFSFEFMSAYTVKKVLPRLVVAAVLIQLSWFIFTLLIQLSNAVGFGLYSLLINAFGAEDIISILGNTEGGGGLLTGNALGVGIIFGVTGGVLAALAPGAWITLALTLIGVVVSILVALFTLIIRKMLIIILLALSPMALIFWILPGTQSLWSTWWKLYSRLLMMFPLIAILFAGGAISANIIMSSDQPDALRIISAIIVYFAPLFLITATFKFAGSVFGAATAGLNKLGGKVSSSGFGLRGRQEAYKKLKNEERAKPVMRKARENMGTALSPEASNFQRLRGRSALGVMGYMPGGKKRMNSAYLNYAGQTEAAELQEAGQSYNALSKEMDFDTKVAASRAIASSTGSTATYHVPRRGADGNVVTTTNAQGQTVPVMDPKTVDVNDAMRRTAAKYVAQSGDVDAMRATVADLRNSGRPDLASKILDENVGDLIKTAPDLYGKTAKDLGHRDLASVKPKTLRNLVSQTNDWHEQAFATADPVERDKLLNNVRMAKEEADRALADTELSVSPEAREMLRAMSSIDTTLGPRTAADQARLDSVIGSSTERIDFAGRKPGQEGYDATRHSF